MDAPQPQPQLQEPIPAPLPPPPSGSFMSQAHWDVFFALLDGAFPAISSQSAHSSVAAHRISLPDDEFEQLIDQAAQTLPQPAPSRDDLKSFFEYRAADDPFIQQDCLTMLARSPQRSQLAKVLQLLTTRLGSLLFTGYLEPITTQPSHVRHAILQSWSGSNILALKTLGKTVASLAYKSTAVASPLFHRMVGYTDVPQGWKAVDGYPFSFIQCPQGSDIHTIETDVVIVGSGCGGSVSAKNIAEAGHEVLVVDKAYYFPPSHFPMPQTSALHHLFDNCGAYMTAAGTSVLAGSAWGGGGTVNWSVCLKPQKFVREEWAASGLPLFASSKFDECLDRVWDFVGASTDGICHNHGNSVLLEGSKRLGFTVSEAPQNTGGKEHFCGQCHLGCGSAGKRGPAVSWLPEAARSGAQFMEGFQVDKVIFGEDGKTATGVEGQWTSRSPSGSVDTSNDQRTQRRVRITAKKVIISAGSLWSPIVLMKSGIENQHLGQNLHVHPCNLVTATFDEDTRPWEGGIITSYSSEFENLDGHGHGVKLEPTCMVPYASLSTFPWSGGVQSKLRFLKYRQSNSFISLTRDRDGGRVFPDRRTGEPRIDYRPSDFDREHTLDGVEALAKICYVTGATEIQPHLPGLEPFLKPASQRGEEAGDGKVKDPEFADSTFAAWLRRVRQVGNRPPIAMWTSAHQMGTCRMGRSEDQGVVDEQGKAWGREGLYVADASVFPSASGVNPMITVLAIADWVSRAVVEELSR